MNKKKLKKLIKKEIKKQLNIHGVVKSLPIERPKLTVSYNELIGKKCFWCGNSR